MFRLASYVLLAVLPLVGSVSITDIQGTKFQSTYNGQSVTDVTGVVTAIGSDGFYIQGPASTDVRESNGLYVFSESSSVLKSVKVGDSISLSGKVSEYRSTSDPEESDLFATELEDPTSIKVLSSNNAVTPIVLGKDRSPPTQELSALDVGPDGWLSVPNNVSQIEAVDAALQPTLYGIDFWASLEGQLVTVPSPTSLGFANEYGEFWVYGDWPVTGLNSRGGLSITIGPDGLPDANPETVIIGSPLDGSKNPTISLGATLSDITGVVQYQFGFYYILPLTAPTIKTLPSSNIPASTIEHSTGSCTITIGDYNVDNFGPTSTYLQTIATHIANYLNNPDIVFLQEIQDNSGETDNGVVSANVTLSNLVAAIKTAGGVTYDFIDIDPVNDEDGGETGGNIRPAYLYRPEKLSLVPGSPVGGSLDATTPIKSGGSVSLSFNPGRIDPTNSAWDDSRKPLAAVWETTSGERLFTVNVQLVAKLDSSSTQGDARPPVNSPVAQRTSQVETIATWVQSLFALESTANLVVGGDFNEYTQTTSVFAAFNGLLTEIDVAANLTPVERYTYVFDQNSEQLDHIFLSSSLLARSVEVQHVHVNNWAPSFDAAASDHDPSVARIVLCGA